jgi:hypothetical protein
MKLSNETVAVLKNFSTINQNLVIKAGSKLSTMSAMKNIVASADVKEVFPQDFAIYDLNEFLAAISLFDTVDLDFKNDFVVITEDGNPQRSLQYWYSDPSVVTHPKTDITMPDPDVQFQFASSTLSEVQKAASIIGAPDMVLEGMSKGNAIIKVTDKKNATANDFKVGLPVDETTKDVPYKFWFKVENLKLIPGSYEVNVSSKKISYFSNTKVPVRYFIALEPESSYPNE